MIVKRDYPCPYKKELKNKPKDIEDDLVMVYTDGMVLFFAIWEFVSHDCSQMAEGVRCQKLENIDLSLKNRYSAYFIYHERKPRCLQRRGGKRVTSSTHLLSLTFYYYTSLIPECKKIVKEIRRKRINNYRSNNYELSYNI